MLIHILKNISKFYTIKEIVLIFFYELINFHRLKLSFKKIEVNYKFKNLLIPTPYYYLKCIQSNLKEKDSILFDIGCGNGRVLDYFKNNFKYLFGCDNFTNIKVSKNTYFIKKNFFEINLKKILSIYNYPIYFYLYNPFSPEDFQRFEKKIISSNLSQKVFLILHKCDFKPSNKRFFFLKKLSEKSFLYCLR